MCRRNEKGPSVESAVSFAPLHPAGFVNFTGRDGARPAFCGEGRACSLFFSGVGRGLKVCVTDQQDRYQAMPKFST